jgi:hypothetical protein
MFSNKYEIDISFMLNLYSVINKVNISLLHGKVLQKIDRYILVENLSEFDKITHYCDFLDV